MSNDISVSSPQEKAILDALLQLPQARHFEPQNIKRFIEQYRDDPRVFWHVKRLGGIGGSEIGAIVSYLRGEQDVFGTNPADIVKEKLLITPPRKMNLAMRKGVIAESCIRQIFLEDYHGEQDFESIHLLQNDAYKRPYSWMRYSPDDIVFINGRRYLCDYKYPGKAMLHDDICLRYISQLHLGKILLEHNGIKLDGMLLVQYPEKGDGLLVSEIGTDESVMRDIIRGGEMIWKEVLSGNVPSFEEKEQPQLSEEETAEISELADRFVQCKIMGEALLNEAKSAQKQIIDVIRSRAIEGGTKLKFNALNVSVSEEFNPEVAAAAVGDAAIAALEPVYSAEKMAAYLRQQGVDMSVFETGQMVYNEDKLRQILREHSLSDKQFMVRNTRMTVSCSTDYKEAAQAAALRARDSFEMPVESKVSTRKVKVKS